MKLILAALLLLGVQAQAQNIVSEPHQYPNESGWALAMISMACDTDLSQLEGLVGTIEKSQHGVIYKALSGNKVVLAAKAKSTSIFSAKTCVK